MTSAKNIYPALLSLVCAFPSGHSLAQSITPVPVAAVSTDGGATTSSFTTKLSKDNGSTFVGSAESTDSINLSGSLIVDSNDLNATADLYVILQAGNAYYLRTVSGSFLPWNGELATLQPSIENATLLNGLAIPIFSGVLGLSIEFNTYLAYHKAGSGAYVYTSAPSNIIITEPVIASSSPFYTPAPVIDLLQLPRSIAWSTLTTAPADLQRFSIGPAGSSDLAVLIDDAVTDGIALELASGLVGQNAATDDLLLRSMFEFIAEDDGGYRIVATKHSNYALDSADGSGSGNVALRDYRSGYKDTASAAYLVFDVSGSMLVATGRKVYDAALATYSRSSSWTAQNVQLNSNGLSLNSGGTALTFYKPPINFDIPFDFNPDGRARVSNAEVPPETKVPVGDPDPVSTTPNQVVAAYSDQLAVAGVNAGTTAAATAMLAQIKNDLAAEGTQMRYPTEFYLALRKGMLERVLPSSDSTDGVVGQLTVPYVYFTNASDSNGTHHPFMVIASYGLPDSLALLWDVARPPGDGNSGGYAEQNVTRSYHREAFLMKIPLKDYGEVSSLTENIMVSDLASDVGVTVFDHHNRASVSATGVAVDGVVIYPSYNNSLHVSQEAAELSAHGMHSGRGLGVHYHADAYSALGEGLDLYNSSDYIGHSHPPIVSIGFDGVAGYGIYRPEDLNSEGFDIPLDNFGGHEHGVYGYHYHSYTKAETTSAGSGPNDPAGNVPYTAHMLPPLGAWAGRINDIPEFWKGPAPDYVGGKSIYLGTE